MYVRVKHIGSKRYAYLAEGISTKGRVRQKTLSYLGPIAKIASGVPDETKKKVDRKIAGVDWYKINLAIRKIPLEFEELQDMKRWQLASTYSIRQSFPNRGRGNLPRADGELLALTIMAKSSFNELFTPMGNRKYRMR